MSSVEDQLAALKTQVAALELFKSKCRCQGPKKPQQKKAAKKKKKVKVDKSDVSISVNKNSDAEDYKAIEAEIRKIEIDGLMWSNTFVLEDFVFGTKILKVSCQIEDLMVPETKPIIDAIEEIKNVMEAKMVNIQTSQGDWGGVSKGKPKGGKKKKKGPSLAITEKEIKAAADQFAMLARNSEVYVAGVQAMDRSGQMDVMEADLRACAKLVSEKKPELCFVLVVAGKTKCTAFGVIPAAWASRPGADAVAMVKAGFSGEGKVTGDNLTAFGDWNMDKEKNQFALKEKEIVTSNCFAYIDSSGLCPDSDDESSSGSALEL